MRAALLAFLASALLCSAASAGDHRSNTASDWNSNYDFPSASSVINRLSRAKLIDQAKSNGPDTQVNQWSYSTTNVGSMNSFDISGSDNSLTTTQSSEGNTSNSAIGGMINDPAGSRAAGAAK